ncbi:hypothetical protein ES332_D01G223400v1, partial [Gossypium tomentosum]
VSHLSGAQISLQDFANAHNVIRAKAPWLPTLKNLFLMWDIANIQHTIPVGGDDCLHYTQVVWSKSVNLGCARAKCANGWVFVICSYDTVGNVEGQRPY